MSGQLRTLVALSPAKESQIFFSRRLIGLLIAFLDPFEERFVSYPSRKSNDCFLVVQGLARSLYGLAYPGSGM